MMTRRRFIAQNVAAAAAAAIPPLDLLAAAAQPAGSATSFPNDFVWGTATAAYQIEGAADADGKGRSVWDTFCRKKDAVWEGHTGDVACDHYHRYREDVALMKQLGVRAYRFSIAWPRVLPQGRGAVNEKGIAFYDRLLDELLQAGITPVCTLFHWDFPEALFQQGGWLNRDVAEWFADYAGLMAQRFSDRISMWVTQNEPQVYISAGHVAGVHAPGLKLGLSESLLAAHNSLRAHAKAVQAVRAAARGRVCQVGYAPSADGLCHPLSAAPGDVEAAREMTFQISERTRWNLSWWLDPVLRGTYPEDGIQSCAGAMPPGYEHDLAELKQPLDFLGINIYRSAPCRRGADGRPEILTFPEGYPRTGVDWQPVTPQSVYWGPKFLHDRYGLPLYLTENGCSTRDQIFLDGKVHDPQRIDLLNRYLLELERAIADGVPVKGYFHWSLLDNFEWADGYKQRFGLVYVDYPSQKRIPKDSFHWYQRVIASNGRSLHGEFAMPVAQLTMNPWP